MIALLFGIGSCGPSQVELARRAAVESDTYMAKSRACRAKGDMECADYYLKVAEIALQKAMRHTTEAAGHQAEKAATKAAVIGAILTQ